MKKANYVQRRITGRSAKRTASNTGGRKPSMIPRGTEGTAKSPIKAHEAQAVPLLLHNQARHEMFSQRPETLLTVPTNATGIAQKTMSAIVAAHEIVLRS